jgi:hypothetical protein
MSKNEIHARISPELMNALKRICDNKKCNLSDIARAALTLYVEAYECSNSCEQYELSKSEDNLKIALVKTLPKPIQMTSDNIVTSVDENVIDW